MNWYKHHIGDYDTHTSHLSILEDGIYCRLLRRYYLTERPLPNDLKELARLIRARSRHEVDALATCVNYYFVVALDGLLHNSRADEEILKYQGQCATNRVIARQRTVNASSTIGSPNQNLEPEPEKALGKPVEKGSKGNGKKDPRLCHQDGCVKLGSRSRSTSGGPFYCEQHFEGTPTGPRHISDHLAKPPEPPAGNGKGKFED